MSRQPDPVEWITEHMPGIELTEWQERLLRAVLTPGPDGKLPELRLR